MITKTESCFFAADRQPNTLLGLVRRLCNAGLTWADHWLVWGARTDWVMVHGLYSCTGHLIAGSRVGYQ